MSSRTILYKGMLTPAQVPQYYPNLADKSFMSALALDPQSLLHQHAADMAAGTPVSAAGPQRRSLNTIRGNFNWMRSREAIIASPLFSEEDLQKMRPIAQEGSSDSGILDNVVEFLMMGGRSLPHVMMMLIPEAWENSPSPA